MCEAPAALSCHEDVLQETTRVPGDARDTTGALHWSVQILYDDKKIKIIFFNRIDLKSVMNRCMYPRQLVHVHPRVDDKAIIMASLLLVHCTFLFKLR